MRISQVYSSGYSVHNKTVPAFSGKLPTKPQKVDEALHLIDKIIAKADEARLDGSIQRIYLCNDSYMAKAPDINSSSAIKEYYALKWLQEMCPDERISPEILAISRTGNRHFIAEEYIKGKHANEMPFNLEAVSETLKKITPMDKTGLVNYDLSQNNIIITPDGEHRIIDFDTFGFLNKDGHITHSKNVPANFFASCLSPDDLRNTNYVEKAALSPDEIVKSSINERFYKSFSTERKPAKMITGEIANIRNLSENPYIKAPSNLTNYEGRSIYRRIIENDVEDPVEFLRHYVGLKANTYHKEMKKFLENLSPEQEYFDAFVDNLSYKKAKNNLELAIDYEDFLIRFFGKKVPDVYFAKLEAAKIQLNGLLQMESLGKKAVKHGQISSAYDKVIKIITEGLASYDDKDYQRYLSTELKRYTEMFENTDYPFTGTRIPILDKFDIVKNWFSDTGADNNSFNMVKTKIKDEITERYKTFLSDGGDINQLEPEIRTILKKQTGERLTDKTLNKGVIIIIEEIKSFLINANASKDADIISHKFGDEIPRITGECAKKIIEEANQEVRDAAQNAKNATVNNWKSNFIKNPQMLIPATGALLALAGIVGYKYFSTDNKKG